MGQLVLTFHPRSQELRRSVCTATRAATFDSSKTCYFCPSMNAQMPELRAVIRAIVLALQGILILIVTTISLRTARGVVSRWVKHRAFRSLPGPSRGSFLAGNIPNLFDANGYPFYQSLAQFGSVAKIHGLFGVREYHSDGASRVTD